MTTYVLYTAKLLSGKTFVDFAILRIFSRELLLNKLFYKFHTRRDDFAIGIRECFPVNGHLHTNRKNFAVYGITS